MLTINGVNVPTPTSYSYGTQDIYTGESGRNANGDMLLEYVTTKDKVELEWKNISTADAARITSAVSGRVFTVTYSTENGSKTGTFYKGDITRSMYDYRNGNPIWGTYKVNIIEV